jgi:hypothetical protein
LFEQAISIGQLKQALDIAEIFVARAAIANRLGETVEIVSIARQGFDLMKQGG